MKIKDATGVASIQEVVERFLSQGATRQHLESLKEENTRQIARLTEEKVHLKDTFFFFLTLQQACMSHCCCFFLTEQTTSTF